MSAFSLSQRNHSSGVLKYSKANERYNENTLHKYPTTKKIEINLKGKKDIVSAFSEDIMLMRRYYEKKKQKIKEKIMNSNQIVYTDGNGDNNSKVKVTFHTPGKNETKYIRVNRNFSKTGKTNNNSNSNPLSKSNEIKSESKTSKYFSSKFNKKENEKRTASKNKVMNSIKQTTISQDEYEFKKYSSLTAFPKNEFNGIKIFIYKNGNCINNIDLELKKNEDLTENKIKEFNAMLQKLPLQRSNKILKIVSNVKSNSQQKLKENKKFSTIEIQRNCSLYIKNIERSNKKKGTLKIEKKEINLIQKNHKDKEEVKEEKKKETMQKHKTETKTIKNKSQIKTKEENKKSNNAPKKIEKKEEENKNKVKRDVKKKSNEKPNSILKQKEVKKDDPNIDIKVKQFVNSIFEESKQNIINTNNEKPKEATTIVQEKIDNKNIDLKPKEEEKSSFINEKQDIEKIVESNPKVNELKDNKETQDKKEMIPLEEKKNEEEKKEEVLIQELPKEEKITEEIKEEIIKKKDIIEEQKKEESIPIKEEEIKEEIIPNTNKESTIKKEPESPIKISSLDLKPLSPTKLNIHPIYIEDKSKELFPSDEHKEITKPHPKPKPIEPPVELSSKESNKEEAQPETSAENIIKQVSTELKLDLPEITRKYIEFNKPVMKNKHKPDFKAFVEEYSKAKEIESKEEETLKEAVTKAKNLRGMLRKKKQNK